MTSVGAARPAAMATALLRVVMGIYFLVHVVMRVTIIGWPAALAFFQSIGLPAWAAYMVTGGEAVIGALLVIGRQVRVAALGGAAVLAGTVLLVHGQNGFLFTNAGGGWEYPLFWMIVLIAQSALGAGAWRNADGGRIWG